MCLTPDPVPHPETITSWAVRRSVVWCRQQDSNPRPPDYKSSFIPFRLNGLARRQRLYWDAGQKGRSLLVSSGGTKTFRSQFKLHDKWQTRTLGRFGEMKPNDDSENVNVATAREMTRNDRALAKEGGDPRQRQPEKRKAQTYGEVVDQFIEQYAKRRQRTWKQTEFALKGNLGEQASGHGISRWLRRPTTGITVPEAYDLLEGMIAEALS
jgi:Arm DNA-binding domain